MITALLGFLVLVFSVTRDEGISVWGMIAGIGMILFGLLIIDVQAENVKIRSAKREYWLKCYDEMEAEKRKQGRRCRT